MPKPRRKTVKEVAGNGPPVKSVAKSLPKFTVTRIVGKWVFLRCGREFCHGEFGVDLEEVRLRVPQRRAAPCPYCSMPSRLPKRKKN